MCPQQSDNGSNASAIRGLGEVALRVENLDVMHDFYERVVRLTLMERSEHSAFFHIADGHGGHTQILALFDRKGGPVRPDFFPSPFAGVSQPGSSLDHFAFEIDLADMEGECSRLEGLGIEVKQATHAWVKWRSLFFRDPEGNTVELVAFDESIT